MNRWGLSKVENTIKIVMRSDSASNANYACAKFKKVGYIITSLPNLPPCLVAEALLLLPTL